MSQTSTMKKAPKRVSKSIRLTAEEARELAHLVDGTAYAEAALMRQWVLSGMQQFRLSEAIRAYQENQADLHGAAEQAQLPVAVLLEEMAARKVAVLERPNAVGPGLESLQAAFGQE